MTAPAPEPAPASSKALVAMFLITLCSVAIVVYLLFRPGVGEPGVVEEVLPAEKVAALNLHRGDVVDATGRDAVIAEEGRWYYVVVDDVSRDGASGVARIGGLVTFVRDARPGEHVVIEVTRLRRSTADAVVIERMSREEARERFAASAPDAPPPRPASVRQDAPVPAADLERHTAVVKEMGRHGDAIVKVEGKVVFLEGAGIGDEVTFTIREDRGTFAIGQLVDRQPGAAQPAAEAAPRDTDEQSADDAIVGAQFTLTVTERDRQNPETDGVARIGGLVVFVPGTQPGDVVRVRIVDRAPRFAVSEVVERLALDGGE